LAGVESKYILTGGYINYYRLSEVTDRVVR